MAFTFAPATKAKTKARIALIGPSGSGKTYTALRIAQGIAGQNGRIAVIDTEHGSASKYSGDVANFDVLNLESHAPQTYVEAIHAAEAAGYDVLIIDSLSHAWIGRDGALEQVDKAAKRSQSGNTFNAWRDVTPHHNALVDAFVRCQCHVIATMRSKTEYVLETNDRGKQVPRKVGLAPVQRDGLEYEADIVAELDIAHTLIITKTRCASLDGAIIDKPDAKLGARILAWLNDGIDAPTPATPAPAAPVTTTATTPANRPTAAQTAPTAQSGGGTLGAKSPRGTDDPASEGDDAQPTTPEPIHWAPMFAAANEPGDVLRLIARVPKETPDDEKHRAEHVVGALRVGIERMIAVSHPDDLARGIAWAKGRAADFPIRGEIVSRWTDAHDKLCAAAATAAA